LRRHRQRVLGFNKLRRHQRSALGIHYDHGNTDYGNTDYGNTDYGNTDYSNTDYGNANYVTCTHLSKLRRHQRSALGINYDHITSTYLNKQIAQTPTKRTGHQQGDPPPP
jgi:hypothetical protein